MICACGCGQEFTPSMNRPSRPQRYIYPHQNKALKHKHVVTLSEPRRVALYESAGNRCHLCGMTMADQIAHFGRRLEIHHKNHDHRDNSDGNHEVLCTKCHNAHSLSVRDEAKKVKTWRERFARGEISMWNAGLTKETDPRIAGQAAKLHGRTWEQNGRARKK